jgi:hypothetical protein
MEHLEIFIASLGHRWQELFWDSQVREMHLDGEVLVVGFMEGPLGTTLHP